MATDDSHLKNLEQWVLEEKKIVSVTPAPHGCSFLFVAFLDPICDSFRVEFLFRSHINGSASLWKFQPMFRSSTWAAVNFAHFFLEKPRVAIRRLLLNLFA